VPAALDNGRRSPRKLVWAVVARGRPPTRTAYTRREIAGFVTTVGFALAFAISSLQ
jgi:hypothetical protein